MTYLVTTPAFWTLVLFVPVCLAAKALGGATIGQNYRQVLLSFAVASLLLASLTLIVFAWQSLNSPAFLDHMEATTAIVAWIYSDGGQLYHSLEAPERYSLLYGPIPYVVVSWMYKLVGVSEFAAKVTGSVLLLVTYLFIVLSVLRRYPGQLFPCLIALGYFSLTALLWSNMSFWVRADPFIIAAASIGLFSCLLRPGLLAWLICGLALGIAGGAKATGVLYFLPYIAWFLARDGFRAPVAIALTGAIVAFMPFWSPEQASLPNYISILRSAAKHGISLGAVASGVLTLAFLFIPVALFLRWQLLLGGMRNWLTRNKLVTAATLMAVVLVTFASSKVGSGRYHYLPFLPALAFLATQGVMHVWNARPSERATVYSFWAPLAAFNIALVLKACINLYVGIGLLNTQASFSAVPADLDAILAKYPQHNVYMGYGGRNSYRYTLFRTRLVFDGNPYLLDLPALQDFEFSGIDIPQSTLDRMLSDKEAVWLVPRGDEPFSIVNWYHRRNGSPLFGEVFRDSFNTNFIKRESSQYFDIYLSAQQGGPGQT